MDSSSLITMGANAPEVALTLNRVALGVFFGISGYLKLFNASRHATLARTLKEAGVPAVPIMQWLVPGVEFSAGCALIVGLLSVLAAFGLFIICLFAFKLDAIKRIEGWQPINRADWIGDVLYLPEALYCIGLSAVMLAGPGPRAVLQRCRPDWDIGNSTQRAAWANDDKAGFYPYGKTQAQVLAEQN